MGAGHNAIEEHSFFITDTWITNAENLWRKNWDLIVLLPCVLYTAVRVPYASGVDVNETDADQIAWFVINRFIDLVFICDILLVFSTSIRDGQDIVTDRRLIARQYFRTWFLFDFVSTMPLDFILFLASADGSDDIASRSTKLVKVAKIFRTLRILRLTKIPKLATVLELTLGINFGLMSILKFVFAFAMLAHLLACGLLSVANEEDSSVDGWLNHHRNIADTSEKYIAAMHYSVQTLTTIGYGDIAFSTTSERIYAIFGMCIGGCCFTFLITRVVYLASMMDKSQSQLMDKLTTINEWAQYHMFPLHMIDELKTFFIYKNRTQYFNEKAMLNSLSMALRKRVMIHMHESFFTNCYIFDHLGDQLLVELVMRIESEVAPPNTVLMEEGKRQSAMISVRRGYLGCYSRQGTNRVIRASVLAEGQSIAECALFSDDFVATESAVALEWSEVAMLKRSKFRELIPYYGDEILMMQHAAHRKERSKSLLHGTTGQHVALIDSKNNDDNNNDNDGDNKLGNIKSFQKGITKIIKNRSSVVAVDVQEKKQAAKKMDKEEMDKIGKLVINEIQNIEQGVTRIQQLLLGE